MTLSSHKLLAAFAGATAVFLLLVGVVYTDSVGAYFAEDFSITETHRRSNLRRANNTVHIGFREQRGRSQNSTRLNSTVKYLERVKEEKSQGTFALSVYERSKKLMDICRKKYPEESLRCHTRNNRLVQRRDVRLTEEAVR